MKTPIANLEDFAALDPFFHIIQEGLSGHVEADHFFDLLADDIVTEYIVTVPDYPQRVEGRAALAELYRPYGTSMTLERCFDLAVYHDPAKGVVVLEYDSEGHAVKTGNRYSNRFISAFCPLAGTPLGRENGVGCPRRRRSLGFEAVYQPGAGARP
jgi:ketosteroid isomerase-like protein